MCSRVRSLGPSLALWHIHLILSITEKAITRQIVEGICSGRQCDRPAFELDRSVTDILQRLDRW